MAKAQPQNKTTLTEKKNLKAKNGLAAKKPMAKKSDRPLKPRTTVPILPGDEVNGKSIQATERSAKIQKKKESKDEIKKFYQTIIVDAKKDNENVKHSINEFLAFFKANATTVSLSDRSPSRRHQDHSALSQVRPARPERAGAADYPEHRYFNALQSEVWPRATEAHSEVLRKEQLT
jgi:hypothetical protein